MKENTALNLAADITSVKTINGVYIPVQLVRKDDDDMMVIVQTTAPINKEIMDQLKKVKDKSISVRVAGTFISYE